MKATRTRSAPRAGVGASYRAGNHGASGAPAWRADIQALRAIAVTVVIVGHFLPSVLPGGFVGVDVFFVISGYLVGGGLAHAAISGRQIRLRDFYARRVRRVVPAALVCSTITFLAFCRVNPLRSADYARQFAATVLFVPNLALRDEPGGYFDPLQPSPFLHFWSLGVEEQFYILAPVTVAGLAAIGLRSRLLMTVGVGSLVAGSFVAAVVLQQGHPAATFFLLPTRSWELGLGVLVALHSASGPLVRRAAFAAGCTAIFLGIVVASPSTPVALAAVLPALGTALLLWRDPPKSAVKSPRLASASVGIRRVGDASYSLYLAHWPVVCWLLVTQGSRSDSIATPIVAMALALFLGLVLHWAVERPTRRSTIVLRHPVSAITVTAAVSIALAVAAVAYTPNPALTTDKYARPLTVDEVLEGPLKGPGFVPKNLRPGLADASTIDLSHRDCINTQDTADVRPCVRGAPRSTNTVVVVGDSHAWHWVPAFERAGKQLGLRIVVITKGNCPAERLDGDGLGAECDAWQGALTSYLSTVDARAVFASSFTSFYRPDDVSIATYAASAATAWIDFLASLPDTTEGVLLGDVPTPWRDLAGCLSAHLTRTVACSFEPSSDQVRIAAAERQAALTAGAQYVDPLPWLCGRTCDSIAGDVLIYRDERGHLTRPAAALLAPRLVRVLRDTVPELQGARSRQDSRPHSRTAR